MSVRSGCFINGGFDSFCEQDLEVEAELDLDDRFGSTSSDTSWLTGSLRYDAGVHCGERTFP